LIKKTNRTLTGSEDAVTEVEQECLRRIAEAKELRPESITLETTLDSIAVDSLDRVTLAFDLEETYGVEIPEANLQRIKSVGDVATAIEGALVKKHQFDSGSSDAA
jgi:acyl carrier protein